MTTSRDILEGRYGHEKARADNTETELLTFKRQQYESFDRLREMLNMGSSPPSGAEIEEAVERALLALADARTDAETTRFELSKMETDHEDEKQLLMSKVHNIEEHLQSV